MLPGLWYLLKLPLGLGLVFCSRLLLDNFPSLLRWLRCWLRPKDLIWHPRDTLDEFEIHVHWRLFGRRYLLLGCYLLLLLLCGLHHLRFLDSLIGRLGTLFLLLLLYLIFWNFLLLVRASFALAFSFGSLFVRLLFAVVRGGRIGSV